MLCKRFINGPAAIAFEVLLQASWETVATTFQFSLLNGGPSSMIYGGILAGFGGTAIALSLAEMASMYVFSHANSLIHA
jgi:choline transport protein